MGAPPLDIPGYIYDTEKGKYFKIEASHTALASSRYSEESVKRRKIEKQQAARADLVAERRKLRVTRALQDPLAGGLLNRELGLRLRDQGIKAWAKGVCSKGTLALSKCATTWSHLDHIAIPNRDPRVGSVYGVHHDFVSARFIPTDEYDNLIDKPNFQLDQYVQTNSAGYPRNIGAITSMRYHSRADMMFLTAVEPRPLFQANGSTTVMVFEPEKLHNANRNTGLDINNVVFELPALPKRAWKHHSLTINTSAPAPPESTDILFVVGSNQGLMQYTSVGGLDWIDHPPLAKDSRNPNEVLSLSFLPDKNPNIVLAGLRTSKISLVDLRAPKSADPGWIRHKSSVAHVHGLNAHQVLAAGPKSAMSIYDVRFLRREGMRPNAPVVTFPAYRNTASIDIGFDVSTELGVVAAASEDRANAQDGRVYLYSLKTGEQLDCPALATVRPGRVLMAMAFQKMEWETWPSLYVGVGRAVQKFSFGATVDEWTGEELKAKKNSIMAFRAE